MKYLSLATYPSRTPRHGGQARVNAIHRVLTEAGWTTRRFAVVPHLVYGADAGEPGTLEMTGPFDALLRKSRRRTDVSASDFLFSDERLYLDRLFDMIEDFCPDVISVEHPWLWPALKKFFERTQSRSRFAVVYSSHNVEINLLRQEMASTPPNRRFAQEELDRAAEIELDLSRNCDAVIAVSESDAEYFRSLSREVHVAPNGIWPQAEPGGLDYWSGVCGRYRNALFVGSAHPPNATGFVTCAVRPSLAYLDPQSRIIVAGRVADLLPSNRAFRMYAGANLARSIIVGAQDEGGLSTMYQLAKVVMLPIIEGGGTNIKTAEALFSRRRVVATEKALRGYEAFMDFPGVSIARKVEDFPGLLLKALHDDQAVQHTEEHAHMLNSLLWSSSLARLPSVYTDLAQRTRPQVSTGVLEPRGGLEKILAGGWYASEPYGIWARRSGARIVLSVDWEKTPKLDLNLKLSGFPRPGVRQLVAARAGDHVLGYASFLERDVVQTISTTLRSADFSAPDVEISFDISEVVSPIEIGLGHDNRTLGVYLRSVGVDTGA